MADPRTTPTVTKLWRRIVQWVRDRSELTLHDDRFDWWPEDEQLYADEAEQATMWRDAA